MDRISVNKKEFEIIELLGKGKGGYSYLVKDENGREYVVKQIHHEPCDYYQFGNKIQSEYDDYNTLRKVGIRMPEMKDIDFENERILKEYVKGDSIACIVEKKQMKQEYYQQIREMCSLLYSDNLNIDYYPTNFIVQNDLIYYVDYECNSYHKEYDFENWGSQYWYSKE